jgi:neutral ceramidase
MSIDAARKRLNWLRPFFVGIASAAIGCQTISIRGYKVLPATVPAHFRAGVGKTDLTPPPGFPTGGHGPAGAIARGYWSRLYARAFYFQDSTGRQLVLVSCDLFTIPGALKAAVARRLRNERLAPEELMIAATHTHQGPGNYASSAIYNDFGSTYPGFDRRLFDFLVDRIAEAVARAVRDADTHPGDQILLLRHDGRLTTPLRNREPFTFLLNWDHDAIMQDLNPTPAPSCTPQPGEPESFWDLPNCPRLRALDQGLTVLEIQRAGNRVGVLVFFAAHPTDLHHDAPLYSSDFTGVAMDTLEERYQPEGRRIVAGFFNGAEGDVTPRRQWRDFREVRRFGTQTADDIGSLLKSPGEKLDPVLEVSYHDLDLRPLQGRSCGGHQLGTRPEFGVATIGGGEDDYTVLHDLGWRDGVRFVPADGQGSKLPGLDSSVLRGINLTKLFAPSWKFPWHFPISIDRIGSLTIAAIPVELTTAMAYELRHAVALKYEHLVIIGLANEYASYLTTPAEYVAQDYIGASTMWGPEEGPFLVCALNNLTPLPVRREPKHIKGRRYVPDIARSSPFGPRFCGEARTAPDEELESILADDKHRPERDLPSFAWSERSESIATDFKATAQRSVDILEETLQGWKRQSTPDDLITVLMDGAKKGTRDWAALWAGPSWNDERGSYRFHVTAADSHEHCSKAFTMPMIRGHEPKSVAEEPCPSIITDAHERPDRMPVADGRNHINAVLAANLESGEGHR